MIKFHHRRKISIEVHQRDGVEEAIVRVLDPESKQERRAFNRRARQLRRQVGRAAADDSAAEDSSSVASTVVPPEFSVQNYASPDFDKGWVAKYSIPFRAIAVKGTRKTGVWIQVTMGEKKELREVIFDTMEDSERFQAVLQEEAAKEKERAQAKVAAALKGKDGKMVEVTAGEPITFLIEVVSAWDIPAGDFTSSDPFVVCKLDGKEVHRTKYISKTLDPIWTLKTNSLFLVTVSIDELFVNPEGLVCTLYDYDNLGKNEKLGYISIPPKQLYEAKGERMEFKLRPCRGHREENVSGYMAMRCRRATDYDKEFMKDHAASTSRSMFERKKPLLKIAEGKTGAGNIKSLITKRSRVAREGPHAGQKQYKVRPGPDPARVEETTWLTKEEIEEASLEPSQNWVDAGSGSLGRLFVEVIGCDDLPNLDTGGFAGNLTDAFVALCYQDAVVRTDVVDDCLAPRWMPWSQRAFIFHMLHSSSQLFLGVFDYDAGVNPADDHDLIGRVSVDVTNLRPKTVYTLKYNICTTAKMSKRKEMGTITIRLRLEIEDERKMLLSNLEPPPNLYVNAKKRKDFRVVRYTCTGKYDMDKYSMEVINS